MNRLALADLRDSGTAWLGVGLAFIMTNATLALTAMARSSLDTALAMGRFPEDLRLDATATIVSNLALCVLVGLAVIGASTSLVVTSRRAAIARLLLAGATPGQVVGLIVRQLAVVSLAAAVVGDVLAVGVLQGALDAYTNDRGMPRVAAQASLAALLAANAGCVLVSVVGGLRQARAASRIPPVEALRAAASGRPQREGMGRSIVRGMSFVVLAGAVAGLFPFVANMLRTLPEAGPAMAAQAAVLAIPLTGLALTAVLPWVVAPLTRAWTRLVPTLPGRGAAWRLARETVAVKAERLVRSVIPVMFAVGLLFGLMLVGETLLASLSVIAPGTVLEGVSVMSFITLLGLPLAIAIAGSAGNLVMMSRQRSAELALGGIIGATPLQQVFVAVFEGVIVTLTASLCGLVMAFTGAALFAQGLATVIPGAVLAVPWGMLAGSVAVGMVVLVLATVLPTIPTLREPAPKVIARLVAS